MISRNIVDSAKRKDGKLFRHFFLLTSLFSVLLTSNTAQAFSDVCNQKLLPIFVGGASNEYVNCLAYDPVN